MLFSPRNDIVCVRVVGFHFSITFLLLAQLILVASGPLVAQEAEKTLRGWASAVEAWQRGQITPNRMVQDPDPSRRGLLVSYDIPPQRFPRGFHRSATYDDAIAALSFLVRGDRDGAAFTLHALARQVRSNGSLWFGYNTANDWPGEADHEGAIVRAGAVGWAGYALTNYLAHPSLCVGNRGCERERAFFLETARRLANYLLSLQVNQQGDARDGLLRVGYGVIKLSYRQDTNQVIEQYLDEPALEISTENNISAWFFLRQLAKLTGENRWGQAADRIQRGLLRATWNSALGQFNGGFKVDGSADSTKALDCASWGALFLLAAQEPEKASEALRAIEGTYAARDGEARGYRPYSDFPIYKDPEVGRYYFPENPRKEWRDFPLVWSEGTLGVALAYLRMGQADRARRVIEGLRPLQVKNSGLRYASRDLPYHMRDAPSVAACAWLVLVAEDLNGNPLAKDIWR